MEDTRMNELLKDKATEKIMRFIPNELGINLCSVNDIIVNRQNDGQIKDIQIDFIPC